MYDALSNVCLFGCIVKQMCPALRADCAYSRCHCSCCEPGVLDPPKRLDRPHTRTWHMPTGSRPIVDSGGARVYSLDDDTAMHAQAKSVPHPTASPTSAFPARPSTPLHVFFLYLLYEIPTTTTTTTRRQQQRQATGYSRTTATCRPPRTPPRGRSSSRPRASGTPPWETRTAKRCSASSSIVSWTPFRTVREAAHLGTP